MALSNFSWVIPGSLAGSAIPGGRLWTARPFVASDIGELKENAISCLVSLLSMPSFTGDLCAERHIEWIEYPIEDFGLPADRESFAALIRGLVERIEAGVSVCVHCRMGIGRTGITLACIVGRRYGISGQQAIRVVRRTRSAIETDEQIRFVEAFCAYGAAGE